MALTTILVHVEANPMTDPRLELAIDLANQFDARLIGIGAEHFRTAYYGDDVSAAYFVAADMEAVEADLNRAEEKFRLAAAAVRQGCDWRASKRFPLGEVAAEARAADLVVTSRGEWARGTDYKVAIPGVLILQAGRPVLVAPPDTAHLKLASVVVAWKDTREARRAVADSLPLLQKAETVHLIEICGSKAGVPAATSRLADVADYLVRHGVKSTAYAEVEEKGASAVDQLLDFAARKHADLIVAGAYGHSRFQEWVFGGFTKALLTQTARAVLFSH